MAKYSLKKDPFYQREAKKYPNPIPSREYIMQYLKDRGRPATMSHICKAFNLTKSEAKDNRMKGFYSCYCPWVRGAIKDGTDQEISSYFCNCSAGYTKKYWDVIFDQPVEVEPIETPLTGGLLCTFAVSIPKEFQK